MTIQVRYQIKTHIQVIDPLDSATGVNQASGIRSARIFNATNWKYAVGEVLLIIK
jgi:hypothetical protein